MRLPSHNQDTKDILRNMSIASDTPEDFRIIEADDYLQPRGTMLEPPPQTPPHHVNMNGKLEGVHFQLLISVFRIQVICINFSDAKSSKLYVFCDISSFCTYLYFVVGV